MKSAKVAVAVATLALVATGNSFADEQVDLVVQVMTSNPPAEVTVQHENDPENVALIRNPQDGFFHGTVPRPVTLDLAAKKKLVASYRVVASWGDASEQLYLGLRAAVPAKLSLHFYHAVYSADSANDIALTAIEALGTDYESTLKKYFRARAFHRYWRFENRQPEHWAALRSARLWFDAAVTLGSLSNSYYRMDDEIKTIIDQYEEHAQADANFRRRYRSYVSQGYIAGTLDQVTAADYAFVGQIPKLVATGNLDEASNLNTKALSALSNESDETRRVVLKVQGVSVDQLKANEGFIATKRAALAVR